MRNAFFINRQKIFIGSLFVLALLLSSTEAARRKPSAKEEVAATTAAWVAALNSREPARITALYDAEAVFWGTTAKTIRATPATVAEYFKTAPQRPTVRCTLGEQHIRIFGELAINSGYYSFSEVRDGKTTTTPARFTFVFRKRGGKWMIVDHHSSRMPDS